LRPGLEQRGLALLLLLLPRLPHGDDRERAGVEDGKYYGLEARGRRSVEVAERSYREELWLLAAGCWVGNARGSEGGSWRRVLDDWWWLRTRARRKWRTRVWTSRPPWPRLLHSSPGSERLAGGGTTVMSFFSTMLVLDFRGSAAVTFNR
jgi:hypothetical protein